MTKRIEEMIHSIIFIKKKKKLSQQQISRIFTLFANKQSLCRANKEPRERRVMAGDCLNPTISPSSLESLIRKGYNP